MRTSSGAATLLLDGVDRDDIEALLKAGHEVFFTPGESIFEVGDEADAMYVVLDGEARVDVGGRSHRLTRGAVFGEMALVAPDRRMATVRAVEPLHVLRGSPWTTSTPSCWTDRGSACRCCGCSLVVFGRSSSVSTRGWLREAPAEAGTMMRRVP